MPEISPKTILIVDDEEEILGHLKNILKRAGFEVVSATKGKEAIDLAKQVLPDLIILDIIMPDIDGAGVAAALSEVPSCAKIPIIFLTGILTKEEELLGKKTGEHRVIAKPVASGELLGVINETLSD